MPTKSSQNPLWNDTEWHWIWNHDNDKDWINWEMSFASQIYVYVFVKKRGLKILCLWKATKLLPVSNFNITAFDSCKRCPKVVIGTSNCKKWHCHYMEGDKACFLSYANDNNNPVSNFSLASNVACPGVGTTCFEKNASSHKNNQL